VAYEPTTISASFAIIASVGTLCVFLSGTQQVHNQRIFLKNSA
jgi:hypothetical protein